MRIEKRIYIDLMLVLAIFILPWWLVLVITIILSLRTPSFYELAVLGFVSDIFYGLSGESLWVIHYPLTWFSLLAFFLIEYFGRGQLRMNS